MIKKPAHLGFSKRHHWHALALLFVVGAAVFASATGTARAQYSLCNKTSYALAAAVGYVDDGELLTRGWWELRAGQCRRVLSDKVKAGRYFVYAEAIPGHLGDLRTWSGRTPLCVQNDSIFTLRDQNVCGDDPRRQREFLPVEVPVGNDGTWTTEFTDERNYSVFAAEVAGVQRLLKDLKVYNGRIDGEVGNATRKALRKYQGSKGLSRTGTITDSVIDSLIVDANTAQAQLGFIFCNATMLPVWAAFAQPTGEDDGYRSAGWWRLEGQECAKVKRGALDSGAYYVYGVMEAESRSVPLAGGDTDFCISAVQFEAESDVPCDQSGYDNVAFKRVDIGEDRSWTFEFTPELFNPDYAGRQ